LIKYIKSVHWRVAKRLSYIEDARCLKVKTERNIRIRGHSVKVICGLSSWYATASLGYWIPMFRRYIDLRNVWNRSPIYAASHPENL